jgi:hypothetical protein
MRDRIVPGNRRRIPKATRGLSLPTGGRRVPVAKRARGGDEPRTVPPLPPEEWHDVRGTGGGYRIVVRPPGEGFRHVVAADEIRRRLSAFDPELLAPLGVIQLSRMTRKKRTFPCYGLQWGSSLYLYPIGEDLIEEYTRPPRPMQIQEARMYGGLWQQAGPRTWRLVWTESAIKDFYLNNVLIHELGHLLDSRNTNYVDRERYAEWFAVEYGYKASRRPTLIQRALQKVSPRHARKA